MNVTWRNRLRATRKSSVYSVALAILVTFFLASNFLLARQNRTLKGQLLKRGQQYLSAGDPVPTLRGLDLNNKITTIPQGHNEKDTLFFIFSPSCGWCKINMANWQAILDQASERYRIVVVSISREGTSHYVNTNGLSRASVIVEPEPRDLLAYKLQLTPQTILVDASGIVKKNWLGAFGSEERQDIESTLGVHLSDSYFSTTAKEISAGRNAS